MHKIICKNCELLLLDHTLDQLNRCNLELGLSYTVEDETTHKITHKKSKEVE